MDRPASPVVHLWTLCAVSTAVAATLVTGLFSQAWASADRESAAFLNIPVGAGPAAMGGAYSASAADAYAPVWNPAGMGRLQSSEVAGQHLSYLESIHYEYLSLVHPFASGHNIGASIQYLGSGDIQGRDETGADAGTYSTRYAAYTVSYGRRLGERIAAGLSVKAIDARIADISGHAFAADAGVLFEATEKLTLAAVAANVGTTLSFIDARERLPLILRFGASWHPWAMTALNAEVAYHPYGRTTEHVGAEWRPIPAVALRAGFRTDALEGLGVLAGFSTGIGLDLWGQEFAYAWLPYGDLGSTQYFSGILRWGGEREANARRLRETRIQRHRSPNEVEEDPDYKQLMQMLKDDEETGRQAQAAEPDELDATR